MQRSRKNWITRFFDYRKEIYNNFIYPLTKDLELNNESQKLITRADIFFGSGISDIIFYKAKRGFLLPGTYIDQQGHAQPGLGSRKIRRGQKLLVRFDKTRNRIEVESPDKRFLMRLHDYDAIKEHLEECE